MAVDVSGQGSLKVGAECKAECGKPGSWRPVLAPDYGFDVHEARVDGSVRVYAAPRFSFNIYDATGPWVELQAYLAATAGAGVVAGERVAYAGLYGGIDATLGAHVRVPILSTTLLDLQLGDFDDDDNDWIEVFGPSLLWKSGAFFEGN